MDRRRVHLENCEQETKKRQESLRGQEDSEQSSKVLTTDRIRAGSNNKSRKTVQPSENAHGLLSHCWWGNQPSYTISKWVQKASLRPDLRTTAHHLWNCIPSAVEESTQLFALDRYSLRVIFWKSLKVAVVNRIMLLPKITWTMNMLLYMAKGLFWYDLGRLTWILQMGPI